MENKFLYGIRNPLDLTILLTVFYLIIFPLSSFIYETYQGEIFSNANSLRFLYLKIFYISVSFMSLWAVFEKKINRKSFSFFEFLLIINITLMLLVYFNSKRLMCLISIFSIFSLYLLFNNMRLTSKINNLLILILTLFLVAPIFLYPFQNFIYYQFFYADSFRGFSGSRTDYGYLTSIVIILTIISNIQLRLKVVLLAVNFVPLAIAQSRAAYLSVIISIMFIVYWSGIDFKGLVRRWFLPIMACVVLFVGLTLFSYRLTDLFADRGGRLLLWSSSLSVIENNLWFGSGDFYQQLLLPGSAVPIEPHNSILQSLLNFGIIGTSAWYLLISNHFQQLNWRGKVFLVNWFVFGMFHTSLDAFLFVPENLIGLLLAIRFGSFVNNSRSESSNEE